MTDTEKLAPEAFDKIQEACLEMLKESAHVFWLWLSNHPDAKNYLRVSFKTDDEEVFEFVLQKPQARRAHCPLCHGSTPAVETTIELEKKHDAV